MYLWVVESVSLINVHDLELQPDNEVSRLLNASGRMKQLT